MHLRLLALCSATLTAAPSWGLDRSAVKPVPGLLITNSVFATVVASGVGAVVMDTEDHFRLIKVTPEGRGYQIKMSAPGNEKFAEIASKLTRPRTVRRQDLLESSRMTLLYASTDPEIYAGRHSPRPEKKVLDALKTGEVTPFVLAPYAERSKDALTSMLQDAQNERPASSARAGDAPRRATDSSGPWRPMPRSRGVRATVASSCRAHARFIDRARERLTRKLPFNVV